MAEKSKTEHLLTEQVKGLEIISKQLTRIADRLWWLSVLVGLILLLLALALLR